MEKKTSTDWSKGKDNSNLFDFVMDKQVLNKTAYDSLIFDMLVNMNFFS